MALLLLVGCASRTEEGCGSGDWEAVGFVDGAEASPATDAKRYASCDGFDGIAWEQGRLRGLRSYCTEARIYRKARTGLAFPSVCQPYVSELSQAFAFGQRYWELDLQMWRLARRSRDEVIFGRRALRSAEYNALRRERALYARWPPSSGVTITEPGAPAAQR